MNTTIKTKVLQIHHSTSHFFYICLAVFASNQIIEKLGVKIPFLYSYLDDLVAIPCTLGIALSIQRVFVFRQYEYKFTPWHILFTVFFFGIYFEGYLPEISSKHTRDLWDLLCYSLGGVGFYYFGMND